MKKIIVLALNAADNTIVDTGKAKRGSKRKTPAENVQKAKGRAEGPPRVLDEPKMTETSSSASGPTQRSTELSPKLKEVGKVMETPRVDWQGKLSFCH